MIAPSPSDEALMERVQKGDIGAYHQLYERWRKPVFSFLVRRTCALSAAEDAHQETWLRVFKRRDRYDARRPFRPWLYTIAANAGRDAWRPDPSALWMDFSDSAVHFGEAFGDGLATHEAPGLRDLLVSALHCLDERDRRIILLVVEGFTTAEIAQMLEMGDGAVRMRLSRARTRIREVLDA